MGTFKRLIKMTYELKFKGAPILKQVAAEVPNKENKINLIGHMILIMKKHGGVGLAAPQIGVSERVIVIRVGEDAHEFINPVIIKRYGGMSTKKERCLSYPNVNVKRKRYARVKIEGYDRHWQRVTLQLSGFEARCAQHEMDHLNGITIA